MSKWIIKEASRFGQRDDVIEYLIYAKGQESWQGTHVWYDLTSGRVNCCSCSGPLSAMLTTCKHAKAVKRFADKLHRPNP